MVLYFGCTCVLQFVLILLYLHVYYIAVCLEIVLFLDLFCLLSLLLMYLYVLICYFIVVCPFKYCIWIVLSLFDQILAPFNKLNIITLDVI